MLLKRLKKRCPSVEAVEKKKLAGYKLVFNKLSIDGSGKANLINTRDKNDIVWGVVHRISWNDKPKLDRAEGLGKGYKLETVFFDSPTKCYLATEEKYFTKNKPYDWYLELTIEGAKENNFPQEYIDFLKSIETKVDEDEDRKLKELSIINDKYASDYNEFLYRNYERDS